MAWLFFAFTALLLTVGYGLISKKILTDKEGIDPIALASSMFILIGVVFTLFYFIHGVLPSDILAFNNPKIIALLILNLIVYTISPTFYFRVLKQLPVSIITIVYSFTGLIALVVES